MSDDVLAQIAEARARIEAQIAGAAARRDAAHRMAEDIRAVSATARSPHGEVSATAQPGGQVSAVTVTDAALELSADALSRLLTATVADAQRKAALAAVEVSADVLGESSEFVAELRSQVDESFPGEGPGLAWR